MLAERRVSISKIERKEVIMEQEIQTEDVPLFLDFVVEVPTGMHIEQGDGKDCVTWGDSGCDDD